MVNQHQPRVKKVTMKVYLMQVIKSAPSKGEEVTDGESTPPQGEESHAMKRSPFWPLEEKQQRWACVCSSSCKKHL